MRTTPLCVRQLGSRKVRANRSEPLESTWMAALGSQASESSDRWPMR